MSFVYGRLVRHKTGADVPPGTFPIEPDLAERWEAPDDTTMVFHLRKGVKWHNKPPLNGREFVAEDVKFTYDRFLTEKANANRFLLEPVDRVEVVDRYTVKFLLKEPFVWLVDTLAYPWSTWIMVPEVAQQYGDFKKPETASSALDPSSWSATSRTSEAVFKRNPEYYRQGQPYIDGVEWLIVPDESTALAMYRTGQVDVGPQQNHGVRQQDLDSVKQSHPHLMYQDILSIVPQVVFMRVDMAPFNDVRVRRAISTIDRQATPSLVRASQPGWPRWLVGAPTRSTRRAPGTIRSPGGRRAGRAEDPRGKTQLWVTTGLTRDSSMTRWCGAISKRSASRRAEAPGARGLHVDHHAGQVPGPGAGPSASPGDRTPLYRTLP